MSEPSSQPGVASGVSEPPTRQDARREPSPPPVAGSALPVFLSTEHWSLLGTRSLTWSEVMSRITIHLTVISAFLVVLALTVQVTGFGSSFRIMAIGLASATLVMGVLTSVRVNTASREDADLVRAMNRIRHAYVEQVPELAPYLTASTHDDEAGLMHTYALGRHRSMPLHVVGSTAFFVMVVNTLVAGTLGALLAGAAGLGAPLVAVLGAAAGVLYTAVHLELARRVFGGEESDVRFPSGRAGGPRDVVGPSGHGGPGDD